MKDECMMHNYAKPITFQKSVHLTPVDLYIAIMKRMKLANITECSSL